MKQFHPNEFRFRERDSKQSDCPLPLKTLEGKLKCELVFVETAWNWLPVNYPGMKII